MVTKEKIREVLDIYTKEIERKGGRISYAKTKYPDDKKFYDDGYSLEQHILYMTENIKMFLREDRLEKAFRWLGFIQGCLWHAGLYTLKELKNHNRSSREL